MDFGSQSFGLADQQQFLYMDFEMIEIFIVYYVGNWNMMSHFFKNTKSKKIDII